MQSTFSTFSVDKIIRLAQSGKLNPDPISQRPPTSSGHKKSKEIVEALSQNLGVGMITVRDISGDPEMQKIYPGVRYTVIDGGHRVRSFVGYYCNMFKVDLRYFKELSEEEQNRFLDLQVSLEVIVCTSEEATKVFQTRNRTTSVNFIEMIMCDDQSVICREVRSRTKSYTEYGNQVHPVFQISRNQVSEWKPECFDTDVNPRRKWDEYVFIAILKTIGNGNVDAGQREIDGLVHNEYNGKNPVSKRVLGVVDRFFDDLRNFRYERGKRLNGDIFAAFQLVWYSLYERNNEFKINNPYKFMTSFMGAYTKLTGTSDTSYNNKIIDVGVDGEQELVNLKEYVRANIKNFSNSVLQKICAELFFKEMGDNSIYGVVFRDEKRSMTAVEKEELLALQGYKCAIDGLPLKLEDSVLGHDTPWSKGGSLTEGAVIRRTHNTDMGSTTLDEYRMILEIRKKKAA